MRQEFINFWVGQGNDALKALHHTRVEGDQHLAELRWEMPGKRLPLL
jgi:hypothetical protein